jgi:hypothetical protein
MPSPSGSRGPGGRDRVAFLGLQGHRDGRAVRCRVTPDTVPQGPLEDRRPEEGYAEQADHRQDGHEDLHQRVRGRDDRVRRRGHEPPELVEVGEKGHICLLPYKMQVWVEMNRYGIGKHANQAQDTGRGDFIVQPKYPIGTDPHAMDRLIEDEIARRGYVPSPQSRHEQGMRAPRDRAAIFNKTLLKDVKHPEVTLRTKDGDELEIVEEPLPEQFDPGRPGEQE